ncbi:MAG: GPR endopeptidase [Clostridia bacterium]|nr:GPR endopeptidase [Clostridia bacterium]
MFDLIDESGADLKRCGYRIKEAGRYGIAVASLFVDSIEKETGLGLKMGDYYILSSPFLHQLGEENEAYLASLLGRRLKNLLKKSRITKTSNILLACLGNFDIEADRLGKEVFDRVEISTTKKHNHLFKICPNIFLYTGIETACIIKMLVKELKIRCVVIIDSLTMSSLARLGTSFQLSNAGMTPGSGVNRFGKAIDEKDVGCSCISIGVPFMISSLSLAKSQIDLFLAPKDVKEDIARAGRVIATAINEVLL